jgi:hypothetical protein
MDLPQKSLTFVIRAVMDAAGRLTGVVERVSTGEKCRFHGTSDIVAVIDRMALEAREDSGPVNNE